MERDDNTADDGLASNDSTTNTDAANDVSRRSVLKTTGVLAASAVGGALSTGSAAAAPNTEPETIDAPYEVHLGDGDVLANKHIVANGSQVSIVTNGSDWEIRNVGIEGKAQSNPITVKVPDSGGSGLVENVYVGGVASSDETPIFVHREHAGTITIRNANVGNASDSHGIYASAPGSPSSRKQGAGGAVQIERSYAHDTGGNGFRIGSDGSYVKDSVAVNCDNSGVWNQWEEGRVENVAIEAGVNAFNVGANSYDNRDGECVLHASNVEYDAPNEVRKAPGIGDWDYYSASNVTQTSSPDLSPPSGVPMSASEAAGGGDSSGGSGGSDSSGSSGGSSDGESDTSDSADDTDSSSDGSSDSAESDDSEEIETESEDAGEESEDDHSDSDSSDSRSTEDDSEDGSDADSSASEDRSLIVEGEGDTSNGPREYSLTVTGTITDLEGNPDDSVSDDATDVEGKVWAPFTDRYAFSGEIDSFETDGDVELRVDGETIDPDSL